MYAKSITDRDLAAVERALSRPLDWYTVDDCRAIVDHIADLIATGKPLGDDERRFIHDTQLRCQFDARYWMDRFAFVRRDDVRGGEGLIELWGSQRIILDHIAYVEEQMWASYERQRASGLDDSLIRVDGIRIALLKARQLGASSLVLLLLLHRFIFWTNLRVVFASADEKKTLEAFDLYWQFAYDRLPAWMHPEIKTRSKDFGMRCESLDTTLFLQNAAQESGIGMGGTSHCGLITEVGLYPKSVVEQMQNHFFRSIPYSLVTLVVLESLAQGQGNFWHAFSLSALRGGTDAGGWHGVFIPWYAEKGKYRKEPPAKWKPSADSLKYAYRVRTVSAHYVGRYVDSVWVGETVILDQYQLYWYESERAKAEKDHALEDFLTNYPPAPEEAFQSRSGSPFSATVLERLSNDCIDPLTQWEWLGGGAEPGMRPADLSINPDDPRGIIRIYEKPRKDSRYKMGVDTAPGIPNWSRRTSIGDDRSKDNAAIEIVRIGQRGDPDTQVAQFIAPIDYVALAPICNRLGRMYRGRDEDMCELIVETGPTSGEALQERLMNEFGYWHLYRKANMATYTHSTSFGWVPTERSRLDLWYRTRPHISYLKIIKRGDIEHRRVKFVARSRYTVEIEMRNCEIDPKLMTAKASFGFHDDDVRALQLALYAAHDWQTLGEMGDDDIEAIPASAKPDYQATDVTRAEMIEDWNDRAEPESGEVW